jgi:hypothetical protein
MDRRDFLKNSFLTWALSSRVQGEGADSEKAHGKLHIQYIRERSPSFEIPPYLGQRYEDRVPDTLDIAERGKLGVHVLTSITDPEADYEIFWYTNFFRDPPVMRHDFSDWVQNVEGLQEALPLLRVATGSDLNGQVDPVWMSTLLKSVGPDGLVYLPLKGRPWSRRNAVGVDPVRKADGTETTFNDPALAQAASATTSERAIATMTVYYLRDKNPMWKMTIEKMIQRLSVLAIDRHDYCYFPAGSFEPNAKIDPRSEMPVGSNWGTTWNTRLIQALAQYYTATGYEPALQLAGKLTHYTRYRGQIFDAEGPWLLDPEVKGQKVWRAGKHQYKVEGVTLGGHGHGHGIALVSVLEYAAAIHDRDLLEFSKAGYEWAKEPGPAYGVSTLVGWFPEYFVPHYFSCEGCTIGDMISIAVKLAVAGVGDYWDDVDRWVRNQFAEQQLTSVDWVQRLASRSPHKPVGPYATGEQVPQRNIGGFGGWASANEWAVEEGIPHCCTGTCTRAIYYVWEHILDHKDDELRVNLLLNRASHWADVYSYIPYQGRVDLKMKESCRSVQVRAPEWVEAQSPQVVCKVNGAPRSVHWEGRHVNIGAAMAGDALSVTFPIAEQTVKERIGPATYTLVVKGNTVVSIYPPGEIGPLYQDRQKYRKQEVQWRQVKRFVPEEEILW